MRKNLLAILISLLFVLMSCSPDINVEDNQNSRQLRVVSNIDTIEGNATAARSLADRIGDPFIGIGLIYTSDGPYDQYTKPIDDETFALYCIFRTAVNGDGMEYNYVLYVPKCIKTEYEAVTHKSSSGSGNAFWWYMRNYLNMSLTEIKADWPSALRVLLESSNLPYPDRNDFTDENSDEYGNLLKPVDNLFVRSADGMDYELGVRQTGPRPMRKLKQYGLYATEEEQKDFILIKNPSYTEGDWSHLIFYPEEIEGAYKKDHPDYDGGSGNPFWSYIIKYYDVSLKDTATVILKAISTGEYKPPV